MRKINEKTTIARYTMSISGGVLLGVFNRYLKQKQIILEGKEIREQVGEVIAVKSPANAFYMSECAEAMKAWKNVMGDEKPLFQGDRTSSYGGTRPVTPLPPSMFLPVLDNLSDICDELSMGRHPSSEFPSMGPIRVPLSKIVNFGLAGASFRLAFQPGSGDVILFPAPDLFSAQCHYLFGLFVSLIQDVIKHPGRLKRCRHSIKGVACLLFFWDKAINKRGKYCDDPACKRDRGRVRTQECRNGSNQKRERGRVKYGKSRR